MIEALRNAFRLPDLRRKMLYTLFILVIYQFAAHVTVPGVQREALDQLFRENESGFLSVLNLLSGGAVSNFSVIANGVYPYITASIIVQLLVPIIPQLQELQQEGEAGRTKLNQYFDEQLDREPRPKTLHVIKGPPGLGKTFSLCGKLTEKHKRAVILTLENELADHHSLLLPQAKRMPVLRTAIAMRLKGSSTRSRALVPQRRCSASAMSPRAPVPPTIRSR